VEMHLEVLGETQINRELLRWEGRIADFSPLFAGLVADFYEMERRVFGSEGATVGGWEPLAASTVHERARLGLGPNPILDRSGATSRGRTPRVGGTGKRSLTTPNSEHSLVRIDPTEMVVGTTDPVMGYHQRGHDSPTELPKRTVVSLSEIDRRRWVKGVQAWITGSPLEGVLIGPAGL